MRGGGGRPAETWGREAEMRRRNWIWAALVVAAVAVAGGDALAKKGGGGKPGGGDPPDTSPPDIAFLRTVKSSGQRALWVMRDDGSGQTQLTGGEAFRASWSPDGTQLAFWGNGFGSGLGPGIYVIDVDGTDLVRVTSHAGRKYTRLSRVEWCPNAAPDGTQWLAFSELNPVTNVDDIFLVSVDGTVRQNVTAHLAATYGAVGEVECSWAPDGMRLLYKAGGDWDGFRFIEFSYDGDGELVLPTTFVDIPSTTAHVQAGEWAKTGDKVVFREFNGGLHDLFVIDFSDLDNISAAVNITNSPDREEQHPSWSPDDSEVISNGVIYDVATGASRTIVGKKDKDVAHASWRRSSP
jgi:Tol biopolymer transport system component